MFRTLYLILGLLLVITGVLFAVLNAETVQLNYYLGVVNLPLSLILVLAMILGGILGVFASLAMIMGTKRENSKLKKLLDTTEKEVLNLRNIPIKDQH